MGWLAGWLKRKSHIITQEVGAGTDYLVLIKVYKGAGTDGTEVLFGGLTGGKVYCGGNCRDDFGDIRFTTDDEETEETHWLEYIDSGNYGLFWVKISADVGAGDVTIYAYYDNASETTGSTDLMEDFRDYVNNNGNIAVTQHSIVHTIVENQEDYCYIDKTSIGDYWVQGKQKYTVIGSTVDAYGFIAAVAAVVDDRKDWIDDNRDYVSGRQWEGNDYYMEKKNGVLQGAKIYDLNPNTYVWFVMNRHGNENILYAYSDEAKTNLLGSGTLTQGDTMRYLFATNVRNRGNAATMVQYMEDMFFRHINDPEVTHGAWGEEEAEAVLTQDCFESLVLSGILSTDPTQEHFYESLSFLDTSKRDFTKGSFLETLSLTDQVLVLKRYLFLETLGLSENCIKDLSYHLYQDLLLSSLFMGGPRLDESLSILSEPSRGIVLYQALRLIEENIFTYRKRHLLIGSAGAGTDYQVRFTVHFGSGSDSGEDVYLDGKCFSDFSDVSFGAENISVPTDVWPYWKDPENFVDGDYAVFWVKVPLNLDSDQVIFIHYGGGEPSYSDLEETVTELNDFETSLDGWTVNVNMNNGNIQRDSDSPYSNSWEVDIFSSAASVGQVARLRKYFAAGRKFFYWAKWSGGLTHYKHGCHWIDASRSIDFNDDGSDHDYARFTFNFTSESTISIGQYCYSAFDPYTTEWYYDLFYTFKHIAVEPSHSTWYSEEPIRPFLSKKVDKNIFDSLSLLDIPNVYEFLGAFELLGLVDLTSFYFTKASTKETLKLNDSFRGIKGFLRRIWDSLSFQEGVKFTFRKKIFNALNLSGGLKWSRSLFETLGLVNLFDFIPITLVLTTKKHEPFSWDSRPGRYSIQEGGVIYVVWGDTSSPTWQMKITAHVVNTGEWADSYLVGDYSVSDGHYDPSLSIRPDGKLIIMWGYYTQYLSYRISTYSVNDYQNETVTLEELLSNWESTSTYSTAPRNISYPDPHRFADKLIVFFRWGDTDWGKFAKLEWTEGGGWTGPTQIAHFETGPTGNGIYWASSREGDDLYVELTERTGQVQNRQNIFFIWSDDRGVTWRKADGSSLTTSIDLDDTSDIQIVTIDQNVIELNPVRDKYNKLHLFYALHPNWKAGGSNLQSHDPSKLWTTVYSNLGTIGTWSSPSNCVDYETGETINIGTDFAFSNSYFKKDPDLDNQIVVWLTPNMTNLDPNITKFVLMPFRNTKFIPFYSESEGQSLMVSGGCIRESAYPYEFSPLESYYDIGEIIGRIEDGNSFYGESNEYILGTRFSPSNTITVSRIRAKVDVGDDQDLYRVALYDANKNLLRESATYKYSSSWTRRYFWTNAPIEKIQLIPENSYYLAIAHITSGVYTHFTRYQSGISPSKTFYLDGWSGSFPSSIPPSASWNPWEINIMALGKRTAVRGLGSIEFSKSFSEVLNLALSVLAYWEFIGTESLTFLDSFLPYSLRILKDEALLLTSYRLMKARKAFFESLSLSDSVLLYLKRFLYEVLNLSPATRFLAQKVLSETISIVESRRSLSSIIKEEILSLADSASRFWTFVRSNVETLSLLGACIPGAPIIWKQLNETLEVVSTQFASMFRTFLETLTLTGEAQAGIPYQKIITVAANLLKSVFEVMIPGVWETEQEGEEKT